MVQLEICCYSIESCITAEQNGANRIELCAGPAEGGVTPSYGVLRRAMEICSIPVYPIIRPRGGDFLYTEEEFQVMLCDVEQAKTMGCKGIVSGVLSSNGTVNMERMKRIKEAAGSMEITFHRAIDVCADPVQAIQQLIELGVTRILTSGQEISAPKGMHSIKAWQQLFGHQILLMAGAGIRPTNIAELVSFTGVREIHSSASHLYESKMAYRKNRVSMSHEGNNEFLWPEANAADVKEMRRILDEW